MIPRNRATGRWSQNRTGSRSSSLIARKQQWSQFCRHVYKRTPSLCYSNAMHLPEGSDPDKTVTFPLCLQLPFVISKVTKMASWYSRICVWLIVSRVIVTQKRCSCSVFCLRWFPLLLPRSPGFLKCLFSNAQHGQEAPSVSVLVSDVQYERAFGVITTKKKTVWQKKRIVPFCKNQSKRTLCATTSSGLLVNTAHAVVEHVNSGPLFNRWSRSMKGPAARFRSPADCGALFATLPTDLGDSSRQAGRGESRKRYKS